MDAHECRPAGRRLPGLTVRLIDAAADLFLGSCCPGCDRPGLGLCAPCRRAVGARRPFRIDAGDAAGRCPIVAAGPADDLLRRLVSAHKDRAAWHLADLLAGRLRVAVDHLGAGLGAPPGARVLAVPVPSTPAAVRRRGYDATWTLARRAARAPGSVRLEPHRALRHTRHVADQSGLDRAARARNLHRALAATPPPTTGPVVVVDDLVTSGATLTEAMRALRSAGWAVLGAAVVGAVGHSPGDGTVTHW